MYVFVNPNPRGAFIGDCAVRAVAVALGLSWDDAYEILVTYGWRLKNLPNADSVWGAVLRDRGFEKKACPDCGTVRDFAEAHPYGRYVLGTGSHVLTILDGDYYDSWDSGDEVPLYYWRGNGIL